MQSEIVKIIFLVSRSDEGGASGEVSNGEKWCKIVKDLSLTGS